MTTRSETNSALQEARAWRKIAERVDASLDRCEFLCHAIDGLDLPSEICRSMHAKIQSVLAQQAGEVCTVLLVADAGEPTAHTSDPRQRAVRVLFCLFLALEAEDEASGDRSLSQKRKKA